MRIRVCLLKRLSGLGKDFRWTDSKGQLYTILRCKLIKSLDFESYWDRGRWKDLNWLRCRCPNFDVLSISWLKFLFLAWGLPSRIVLSSELIISMLASPVMIDDQQVKQGFPASGTNIPLPWVIVPSLKFLVGYGHSFLAFATNGTYILWAGSPLLGLLALTR